MLKKVVSLVCIFLLTGSLLVVNAGTVAGGMEFSGGGFGTTENGVDAYDYVSSTARAYDLAVDDNYVYVAGGTAGVHIFDRDDLSAPVGSFAAADVRGIAVNGDYVYFLEKTGKKIITLDVTDRTSPIHKGEISYNDGGTYFTIDNGYLYLSDGENGVKIFNIAEKPIVNAAAINTIKPPVLINAEFNPKNTNIQKTVISDGYAYMLANGGKGYGYFVYNLNDITSQNVEPVSSLSYTPDGKMIEDIVVWNNYLIGVSKNRDPEQIHIVDVSNKADIKFVEGFPKGISGSQTNPNDKFTKICVYGDILLSYGIGASGKNPRLTAYDIPKMVSLGSSLTFDNARITQIASGFGSTDGFGYGAGNIVVSGNEIFVAHNQSGIKRFYMTKPVQVCVKTPFDNGSISDFPYSVNGTSSDVSKVSLVIKNAADSVIVNEEMTPDEYGNWSYSLNNLEKGNYSIIAEGLDEVGQPIAGTAHNISFKAVDKPLLMTTVFQKKLDYIFEKTDVLEPALIRGKVFIENIHTSSETENAIALFGIYNDNQLLEIKTPGEVSIVKGKLYEYKLDFNYTGADISNLKIKAFVWDGLKDIVPIDAAVELAPAE